MDSLTLIVTAVALGTDAFAVAAAVAAGLERLTFRHIFRLSWHFGFFQAMMTVIGWFGGESLSALLFGMNHWIAFIILAGLGANMIRESSGEERRSRNYDPTRGWSLVGLSVATSIDALAVGLSLGLVGVSIWIPAAVIGGAALLMTLIGAGLGRKAGVHLGEWAERIGGTVLVLIGLRIAYQGVITG